MVIFTMNLIYKQADMNRSTFVHDGEIEKAVLWELTQPSLSRQWDFITKFQSQRKLQRNCYAINNKNKLILLGNLRSPVRV